MKKVLVIGEILVDSFNDKTNNLNIKKVGGAPFNVAYNLSSLGDEVTFIGQVGDDENGEFILSNINKNSSLKIEIEKLKGIKTTVAKVISNGESVEYFFERENTSDYQFDFDKLFALDYSEYDLVHFGSLMLSVDDVYEKILKLIKIIKKATVKISFDVNLRADIFKSNDIALKKNQNLLDYIDVLKTSKDEIMWLASLKTIKEINDKIDTSNKYLFITDGSKGAYLLKDNKIIFKEIYKTDSIDFVGCGDSFFAGALHEILKKASPEAILSFANATGSLTTKVKGALGGYQNENEVINFIKSY